MAPADSQFVEDDDCLIASDLGQVGIAWIWSVWRRATARFSAWAVSGS